MSKILTLESSFSVVYELIFFIIGIMINTVLVTLTLIKGHMDARKHLICFVSTDWDGIRYGNVESHLINISFNLSSFEYTLVCRSFKFF